MRVEATYDRGRLKFDKLLRFVQPQFRVLVEVPNELVIPDELEKKEVEGSDKWLSRLEDITREVLTMSEDELPEVTKKQEQYMKAFTLREDR